VHSFGIKAKELIKTVAGPRFDSTLVAIATMVAIGTLSGGETAALPQ
jgi:hypothetical protein